MEKALVKRGRLAAGAAALEAAGMTVTLPNFVLTVGLWAVVATGAGFLIGGLLLGLLMIAVVVGGARLLVMMKAGRRRAAFADQLDDSLQLMASSLRAGHSLLRAVDAVSQDAVSPTAEEFSRIVNETRVGRDLSDSLDEVAERMRSDDFLWVAQAIAIHREVGGNLAEVLDAVGHTIRERNQIRRQVKALSAEGKLSAIVLGALPFVIIGFLSMTNPGYLAKFTESVIGYGMIAGVVVLMLVGGFWLKKTVAIKF
jgi:tight adherence protein B